MMEELLIKIIENPIFWLVILILTFGIFHKIYGEPFKLIINNVKSLPQLIKLELKSDAGRFNLFFVLLLFFLLLYIIHKIGLASLLMQMKDINDAYIYFFIFPLFAVMFAFIGWQSLKRVKESENLKKTEKKIKELNNKLQRHLKNLDLLEKGNLDS